VLGMLVRLGVNDIVIELNRAHFAIPPGSGTSSSSNERLVPIGWVIHIQVVMFGSASFLSK